MAAPVITRAPTVTPARRGEAVCDSADDALRGVTQPFPHAVEGAPDARRAP